MDTSDLALTREEDGYLARAILATLWDLARPLTTRELAAVLEVGLAPLQAALQDLATRRLVTLSADGELVSTPNTDAITRIQETRAEARSSTSRNTTVHNSLRPAS
jgi:DNA-binding GntR family transcriptional regulator